jgi:hypothetical protein
MMTVFWAPCNLVEGDQRFIAVVTLMMEAASAFRTPVNLCETTSRSVPEGCRLILVSFRELYIFD